MPRPARPLASSLALSLALAAALPAAAGEVTAFTLDNGLEVVVIENHRAPVAVHMVWYRVGAADEPPGKSGIAHFLEHLMFKGTDERAAGEFSALVAENGGTDNAFTAWDYTAYFQRVAADRLELMMALEADRMRDLAMTPEDVATELQVILEERAQRVENDPGAIFAEQRRAAQYLNHPYAIPIIGWRHEMERLTREDALDFYRRFYAPDNAILVVAGDVEPEAVRAMAERHYGALAPSGGLPPRQRPAEPPQLAERRVIYTDPRVAQPYVMRTWLAPERDPGAQEEAAALVYLAEILGGSGATSVLGRKLQFESRTAIYTTAFYEGVSLDDTTFGMAVVPAEGVSLAEAEAAMDRAIAEFLAEGIDREQFARVKFQIRAAEIFAQDDIQGLARRYGEALTSGLTVADIEAWPAVLDAVTADDVMAAAARLFDRRQAVTGWISGEADGGAPAAASPPAAAPARAVEATE
jgi:zinc protease